MTDLSSWCDVGVVATVGDHHAHEVVSNNDSKGVEIMTVKLPHAYAESDSLARIADRLGKEGVAKFLRNKFPTKSSARSGDMGEVLAAAYLQEVCGNVVGPSRLIWRDHQEWAMRGDDVLGARVDSDGKMRITKVEAKSRVTVGERTVEEAREALMRNDELPSPHSLTQFGERLLSTADSDIGSAVLEMQISDGVRPSRVRHLMFLFTGSDPSEHVTADLTAYAGSIPQRTVTLRVNDHPAFIKNAYEAASSFAS